MKTLQRFCTVAILTSVLAFSATAGDIQAPGATTPPPEQHAATGDTGVPGATDTGETSAGLDQMTEAVLSALHSLLLLL
jgi:hypothetical protein